MTRVQFLNDLYRRLGGLTQEQAEQHLTYYAEMLADRMEEGMTEEDAVAGMEDVDTIARRILEEEGLPYEPPVTPPACPDASKLPGGGGTKGYQPPKKRNNQKIASILLWALAAICVLGAVKRLFAGRAADTYYDEVAKMVDVVEDTAIESVECYDWAFAAEDWDIAWVDPIAGSDQALSEQPCFDSWNMVGHYDIPADAVQGLQINWISGAVDIQGWNGDFELVEYSDTGKGKMTYTIDGNILSVQANGASGLLVKVPSGWLEDIEINAVSAAVRVENTNMDNLSILTSSGSIALGSLYASSIEATTVSGGIALYDLFTDSLDLSTSSGNIMGAANAEDLYLNTISGDICMDTSYMETVEGNSVSGNFLLMLSNSAEDINLQSKSGDVTLTLFEEPGFQLNFDTISGDIREIAFPASYMDGVYTYGDGSCGIDISTTSGDVYLLRQ